MCGNATAPWAYVAATAAFLNLETVLHQGGFHITSLVASHAMKIERISISLKRLTSSRTPSPSLLDMVSNADHFDTTDPRDKIFGLLGLVEKFPAAFPDYRLTVNEVYTAFTEFYLEQEQNYYILGHRCSFDSGVGLPSWTQDWTSRAPIPLSYLCYPYREKDFYESSPGSKSSSSSVRMLKGASLLSLVSLQTNSGLLVQHMDSRMTMDGLKQRHCLSAMRPAQEFPIELKLDGDVCSKVIIVPKR